MCERNIFSNSFFLCNNFLGFLNPFFFCTATTRSSLGLRRHLGLRLRRRGDTTTAPGESGDFSARRGGRLRILRRVEKLLLGFAANCLGFLFWGFGLLIGPVLSGSGYYWACT
ncbi:hypothetical protein V6Z11_D07G216700 [Gossypium hirsutum]